MSSSLWAHVQSSKSKNQDKQRKKNVKQFSCSVSHPQCDGTDLTPKIQELKFQCIVFLNIPRFVFFSIHLFIYEVTKVCGSLCLQMTLFCYAIFQFDHQMALSRHYLSCASVCMFRYCAGTMPWGNPGDHRDFEPQRHDDGCIEVIGFTMASLVRDKTANGSGHEQVQMFTYYFPFPLGGAAGGRSWREASPVQGGGSDHLQNCSCAGEL